MTDGKYIHVKSPDKDILSELVIKAKGPRRSLRQFSVDIGVNASTLSRIINKKTTGSNSTEVILKIAAGADPESGVTEEMLLDAHGVVLQDDLDKADNLRKMGTSIQGILVNELLNRGFSVMHVYRMPPYNTLDSVLGRCYVDCCIDTDALGSQNSNWLVDVMPTIHRRDIEGTNRCVDRIRQWLLMFTGMIAYNEDTVDKFSIVIPEREIYEELLNHIKGFKTRYTISIIYADIENGTIADEYMVSDDQSRKVFKPIDSKTESDNSEFEEAIDFKLADEVQRGNK